MVVGGRANFVGDGPDDAEEMVNEAEAASHMPSRRADVTKELFLYTALPSTF